MYSIDVTADYGTGRRSRGLAATGVLLFLKGLLLLPHAIIVGALGFVTGFVAYIGYWVILFTGELPEFFFTFPLRTQQWSLRMTAWLCGWTDSYPPFEWEPDGYSARLDAVEGPGGRNRVIALLGALFNLKGIALLPHYFLLMFITLAAVIATWVGYVAVLFTGALPRGIFEFTMGAARWSLRVTGWLYSLTDEYPPFRMTS